MSASSTRILRLLFWVCWAGTIVFFLVNPYGRLFGRGLNDFGLLFISALIAGLCFISAAFVKTSPHLARLGILTLVVPVVLFPAVCVIMDLIYSLKGHQ